MCISIKKSILNLYRHVVVPFIFIEIMLAMFRSGTVLMGMRHFLVDILLIPYYRSTSPSLFLQEIRIEKKMAERERRRRKGEIRMPQSYVWRDLTTIMQIYQSELLIVKVLCQSLIHTAIIEPINNVGKHSYL